MNAVTYIKPNRISQAIAFFKKRSFSTKTDSIVSIILFSLILFALWKILDWGVFRAVWSKENVDACRLDGAGACWSVIDARHRIILFGLYPFEEHWRSTLACLAIIGTVILSCIPSMWPVKRLIILWVVGFATYYLLMEGSLLGLQQVTTDQWGGLALTLFLFASVVLIGMPAGLALALMRRSEMPVVRMFAALLIDTIRSLPLLVTLFAAAVVLPIVLPSWLEGDKIWRVIVAFAMFFACYQAEVFRGGFQAIPNGQFEAGKALGLTYMHTLFKIILPQVFRNALPSTINMVVITFKETAIVIIIGFFEILASANAAYGTGEWTPYYLEVLAFVAAIYWLFLFSLGQYGEFLKGRMSVLAR